MFHVDKRCEHVFYSILRSENTWTKTKPHVHNFRDLSSVFDGIESLIQPFSWQHFMIPVEWPDFIE